MVDFRQKASKQLLVHVFQESAMRHLSTP